MVGVAQVLTLLRRVCGSGGQTRTLTVPQPYPLVGKRVSGLSWQRPVELEQLVDRQLVIGMTSVFHGDQCAVGVDENVCGQSQMC